MKLESLFLGIVLTALSPQTAQQFDSMCNDGANLAVEASEARDSAAAISIDEMLSRAYQETELDTWGRKLTPIQSSAR